MTGRKAIDGKGVLIKFPGRQEKRRAERLEWYRSFGQRLRKTRLALGISEVEAAAACLVTLRTYRRREAGLPSRGGLRGLISFAQTYDLSHAWLFAGGGPMRASEYAAEVAAFVAAEKAASASRKPKLTIVPS